MREKSRAIRGETANEQAEELLEEGIPIAKLPWSSRRRLSMEKFRKRI